MSEQQDDLDTAVEQELTSVQVDEIIDDHLHEVSSSTPTLPADDQWVCPECGKDFSQSANPHASMRGHFLGKTDGNHGIEVFRQYFGHLETPKPKKPTAATGSVAVRLKPITTEFMPDEEQEISGLKRETAILKERLAQKNIADKLGVPEREERVQQDFYAEEMRKETILKAKDREISELHKRMEKEKDRNHEKELAQIKTAHNTDIKLIKIQQEFQLEMQKMKTELVKDVGDIQTEYNKTVVRGMNTFVDLIVEDFRDKKATRKQTAEQRAKLRESVGANDDQGILAILERDNPQIIKDK